MQPEALQAATLPVSLEHKSFTTNHRSILKIVRFNAQNMAQFDAFDGTDKHTHIHTHTHKLHIFIEYTTVIVFYLHLFIRTVKN